MFLRFNDKARVLSSIENAIKISFSHNRLLFPDWCPTEKLALILLRNASKELNDRK